MSIYLGNTPLAVSGPSRNIGEIIQSTIPLSDAGLHLLDGALISGTGSYGAFVTYIAGLASNYPDLFITETAWQQSVTDYGVCGKFVYDSTNNTVRLPKITGFTEGTTDVTALGDLIEAGLPNITGTFAATRAQGYNQETGAFSADSTLVSSGAGSGTYGKVFTFNASQSNNIYGNSTTVQPQAIKVLYYIVIANSVKTNIEVDIDEIATDLNGKADVDLSNVNVSGTSLASGWAMPSSRYIDLTLGASGATYTAPANGWFHISKVPGSSSAQVTMINTCVSGTTDQTGNFTIRAQASTSGITIYLNLLAKKGDIVVVNYTASGNTDAFRFIYAEGEKNV